MWNAKRALLAVSAFGGLCVAFLVYSFFLGGIDGLPPLPQEYWPGEGPAIVDNVERPVDVVRRKLAQAFGPRSDVLNLAIKLEMSGKGMVLATDDFRILEEDDQRAGQVKLQPFRVALFGKSKGPDGTPEINTISCDVAYLEFDQRVNSLSDLSGRKVKWAELSGRVTVVNNRRTPQQDDDMSLFTQGPVYYQSDRDYIFSPSEVRVVDLQSKPQPATMYGSGMDIQLVSESNPRKPKSESITGVEYFRLRSAVEMHLFVDGDTNFMASGKTPPHNAAPPAKTPAKKAHLKITTDGPFVYYVQKERAEFDISGRESFSTLPKVVEVIREHEQNMLDHLLCDHLELQFKRKQGALAGAAAPQAPPAANALSQNPDVKGQELEIERAHATAEGNKEVVLSSDAEALEAYGKDLFYEAHTKTSVLKGETMGSWPQIGRSKPMRAVKDGHVIYARELRMSEVKPGQQQAVAIGPGRIDLYDKKTDKHSVHAHWDDQLVSGKDGTFDLLTLTGNAFFQDDEHDQRLRGDQLKVWLQPGGSAGGDAAQRARPHHVEARGHVAADSADMHVTPPTEVLVIWFKDMPASAKLPPAMPATGSPGVQVPARLTSAPAGGPPAASIASSVAPPNVGPTAAGQPIGTKQPFHLSARSVECYVLRSDVRNDLERLWCEGDVQVRQLGSTAEEYGVDIKGDTLQLTHFADGNVLAVTGNLAHVRMNETRMLGPEVNIDQKTNVAQIKGVGFMSMPSKTDLQGATLALPGILTIGWREGMVFDGRVAEFHGGVQARQDHGRLLCQEMQVELDRAVSFKEGDKGKAPAKVQRLVCDQRVFVEDRVLKEGKLESYKRLTAPVLTMDNEDEIVRAPGPGMVHILQVGGPEDLSASAQPGAKPAPKPKTGKPQQEILKLTRVSYRDRLYANNKSRIAVFYGDVKVVHLPTDDPDIKIDLDKPPPGFFYMTCEKLTEFTDSNKSQQMEAQGRVLVQAQEFWGRGDTVRYDEGKDQVIFIGSEGSPATLSRQRIAGQAPETVSGQKITYWRKTNDVKIDNGDAIKVSP